MDTNFDYEEEYMPKGILFSGDGIRARRCAKCNTIKFVNDTHGEWKYCRECKSSLQASKQENDPI